LIEAVESILGGEDVPTEIIIIDQSDEVNSQLSTLTSEHSCEVRYFWTQTIGLSRASNKGIAEARFALLAFTHDDVMVTPTWFRTLIGSLLQLGPRTVVTGQVLVSEAETPGGFQLTANPSQDPVLYEGRIGIDVLFPLNMAMYRSAVDEVGNFDERLGPGTPFPAAEDNDFGFRLLEKGYRISYIPEAVLYHRAWRPGRDYLRLRWSYGRGQGAYYAKYFSLRDPYMLRRMLRDVGKRILRFPIRLWRQRRQAYSDAIFVLGLFSGIGEWLLKHSKTECGDGATR
jgi:GT2 family glycosyltransferase